MANRVEYAHRHIIRTYGENPLSEWKRLVSNQKNGLEFSTTLYFLDKYLPKRGSILDAGGGPGRYTVLLAKRGYKVTLLDATKANIEFATKIIGRGRLTDNVERLVHGRIENLSEFDDNSFDAVICLGGPLSHVMDKRLREKAVRELLRVSKKNAPIFVSVMGRLMLLKGLLMKFQPELEAPYFKVFMKTGDYFGGYGFTAFHGFMQEELKHMLERAGAHVVEMAGLEGFGSYSEGYLGKLHKNKKRWDAWMKAHIDTCTRPEIVGTSEHMLIVCRK